MKIMTATLSVALLAFLPLIAEGGEPTMRIVAAENYYGDMVQQIAGSGANVSRL